MRVAMRFGGVALALLVLLAVAVVAHQHHQQPHSPVAMSPVLDQHQDHHHHHQALQAHTQAHGGDPKPDDCPDGKQCCPICGMTVPTKSDPHVMFHNGQKIHFCGKGCAAMFAKDPLKYATNKTFDHKHEVVDGTTCPYCGMAGWDDQAFDIRGNQHLYFCPMGHINNFKANPTEMIEDDSPPDTPTVEEPFCRGSGTVMSNGFTFLSEQCSLFLFPSWNIDTPVKFAFSVIGLFILAMAHELLSAMRRKLLITRKKHSKTAATAASPTSSQESSYHPLSEQNHSGASHAHAKSPKQGGSGSLFYSVLASSSYAVGIAIGYFLMLMAMTYELYFLVAIVLGFGVGNFLFSDWYPVAEVRVAEPCCP